MRSLTASPDHKVENAPHIMCVLSIFTLASGKAIRGVGLEGDVSNKWPCWWAWLSWACESFCCILGHVHRQNSGMNAQSHSINRCFFSCLDSSAEMVMETGLLFWRKMPCFYPQTVTPLCKTWETKQNKKKTLNGRVLNRN